MTLADAVSTITANPAPVVFLDSCILLDTVRAPLRNAAGEVRVASQFLVAVGRVPKTIHLIIGSPTPTEWNDHIDEAVRDCTLAVNSYNAVADVCGYLAIPAVATLPAAALDLPTRLRQLSADLLAAAIRLDHHADALARAVDRVVACRKPATKGGKGAKDAVILEHVLETTRQLRAAGYPGICVFTSSNTKDFGVPPGTNLHPLLVPDFAPPVDLLYATSLTRAETLLLGAGWVP
ncbi:MAG: hypothetical protein HYS12_01660 [Planctomycetes bacterium]|nr:hypothetical protein [Planctomycetota bacterium]